MGTFWEKEIPNLETFILRVKMLVFGEVYLENAILEWTWDYAILEWTWDYNT